MPGLVEETSLFHEDLSFANGDKGRLTAEDMSVPGLGTEVSEWKTPTGSLVSSLHETRPLLSKPRWAWK